MCTVALQGRMASIVCCALQAAQGFTRLLAAAEDAALDTPAAAHLLVRRFTAELPAFPCSDTHHIRLCTTSTAASGALRNEPQRAKDAATEHSATSNVLKPSTCVCRRPRRCLWGARRWTRCCRLRP
jgi:hypothetical protein